MAAPRRRRDPIPNPYSPRPRRVGQPGRGVHARGRMPCPPNSTFVTLLAGRSYLQSALCLPHQLRALGSACPIALVYDDTDSGEYVGVDVLAAAYGGASQLYPLSALRARHAAWRDRTYAGAPAEQMSGPANGHSGPATHGARPAAARWQPNLKLWAWALPGVASAVFLDTDVLLLHNVDHLLSFSLELTPRQQRAAATCKSRFGDRFFNTGVFAFRPSLPSLERLLRMYRYLLWPFKGRVPAGAHGSALKDVTRPPPAGIHACAPVGGGGNESFIEACLARHGVRLPKYRVSKACESAYTDQSVINAVLGEHHLVLPPRFNQVADVRWVPVFRADDM